MSEPKKKHNVVEVVTFAFGLVVLASLVGYLAYQFFTSEDTPPNLEVTVKPGAGQCCAYKVIISNSGSRTAEAANIKFERRRDGTLREETLSIDYIPANSKREAMLVFPDEIRAGDVIVVSAISFNLP